jgi:peptidyl-prolyl cis-trans isomerase C
MIARRRWTLALLAAAATLAAAGAGAQSSRRAAAGRAPDSVLVRLGKDVITTGQVQRRLDELPEHVRPQFTTPDGRQRLLDRLIEEKVWLASALKKGVERRPEVVRQIEQARRDLLIRTVINEIMADNPAPSDSEAHVYYDEHLAEYRTPATATLSHIQTRTEAEAKRARQWARNQDWAKLVAKVSNDSTTRDRAGMLGPVTREGVFGSLGKQPALAESAFALGEGKIGGPYKTDRGWHVIKVESLKPEGVRPFDQVRGGIIRQLSSKRSQDYYQERYAEAKAALGVRADSSAIRKFVSAKKSARDLFNEAQLAGGPQERLQAYRTVVEEYPESDVGPQAQFMIGFIQSEELRDYDAAERSFKTLLERYPKSELAASAKWMVEHMRTETAPGFMNLESDSANAGAGKPEGSSARKP